MTKCFPKNYINTYFLKSLFSENMNFALDIIRDKMADFN